MISLLPVIPGLSEDHRAALSRLAAQLMAKSSRNRIRRQYYDYKQGLKDLGIALPPSLKSVEAVLGVPAKAVDSMVRRTVLDKWSLPDNLTTEDLGIDQVYEANRLDSEIPAALTSTLMHAVTFGFVTAGGPGEPESMISFRSAEWATGSWDSRRRCISEALSVQSVDQFGIPDSLAMYLPNLVILMRRHGADWELQQATHDLGVPVEPIPFRPLLDRPFGSSRITRPIMALTDSAVRTMLRTEVGAEFYNAPQRYALGAPEKAFDAPGWLIRLGALLTIDKDEDGDLPTVGQFAQQSMTPNVDQMNMIMRLLSAETNLPLRSLGVMGDNVESAESQRTAERDFVLDVKFWQQGALTPAFQRLMTYALRLRDDSPAAREVYRKMRPHWQRPDLVSPAEAADAVTKLNSAITPGSFGGSEVGLEMAGLEPDQIVRWQAEQRRTQGAANLTAILDRVGSGDGRATAL